LASPDHPPTPLTTTRAVCRRQARQYAILLLSAINSDPPQVSNAIKSGVAGDGRYGNCSMARDA
jgi:hypothetical protein